MNGKCNSKIVLLAPPIQDFYHTPIRLIPLGLGYLKATIKKFFPNLKVIIKDYHFGYGQKTIPLPKELSYLKDFYFLPNKSPFCTFTHFYHFGASFEEIITDLKREDPYLIAISASFTAYFGEVLTLTRKIKQELSNKIPILLGGAHVSAIPSEVLKENSIDFIIRGEGERPVVEFIKHWINTSSYEDLFSTEKLSSIPNLGFKSENKIRLNPLQENFPLSEIPYPDFSDLDSSVGSPQRKIISLISSRSCPHHCQFCSIHSTFGNKYRRRDTKDIIAEMKYLYTQGFRQFNFEDDNLVVPPSEFLKLCEQISLEFSDDITVMAMNGISYWYLDETLLTAMKKAYFSTINLSLVSTDSNVLAELSRPHSTSKFIEVVNTAHRLGLSITAYLILGLPGQPLESTINTLITLAELPLLIGASVFYLTPDMPYAKTKSLNSANFLNTTSFKLARNTAMTYVYPTTNFFLSRNELFTLFTIVRIINFLKTSFNKQEYPSDLERKNFGIEIITRLEQEGILYAYDKKNFYPIKNFLNCLWKEVCQQLSYITTITGDKIITNKSGPKYH